LVIGPFLASHNVVSVVQLHAIETAGRDLVHDAIVLAGHADLLSWRQSATLAVVINKHDGTFHQLPARRRCERHHSISQRTLAKPGNRIPAAQTAADATLAI